MTDTNNSFNTCLCLDGGGVRGIAAFTCLSEMVRDCNQNANFSFRNLFSTFTGVSIGGLLISVLRERPTVLYESIDPLFTKLSQCISHTPFFRNPRKQNSLRLTTVCDDLFGEVLFYAPEKTRLLIPCFNVTTQQVQVFDSHAESNIKLKDVVLATTAHPLYFLPYKIENYTYIDGGVSRCNPIMIAAAVLEDKDQSQQHIKYFSLGTGETRIVADDSKIKQYSTIEWVSSGLLNYMCDTYTTDFIAQRLLKDRVLRITSRSKSISSMSNITTIHILYLKRLGSSWYWENRDLIKRFLMGSYNQP